MTSENAKLLAHNTFEQTEIDFIAIVTIQENQLIPNV